jgi:hypothetical protein
LRFFELADESRCRSSLAWSSGSRFAFERLDAATPTSFAFSTGQKGRATAWIRKKSFLSERELAFGSQVGLVEWRPNASRERCIARFDGVLVELAHFATAGIQCDIDLFCDLVRFEVANANGLVPSIGCSIESFSFESPGKEA